MAIVTREVTPLTAVAPWTNPELAAVVHKALQRDVGQRYATARDLLAALRPLTGGTLSITSPILVGVTAALDKTVSPGVDANVTPRPTPEASTPAPTGGTNGGVTGAPPPSRARGNRSWAVATAAVAALLIVGGLGERALMSTSSRTSAGAPAAIAAPAIPVSATVQPPAPLLAAPESDVKVGVVTLKIPAGFTLKVDGCTPGAAECTGAPKAVSDGKLELRGEFQRKFLVAVYDKAGKRTMVQDVYLYDNKADPDTIDSSVGAVAVEKPKRKAPLPAAPSTVGAPSSPPTSATSSSDLPPRF